MGNISRTNTHFPIWSREKDSFEPALLSSLHLLFHHLTQPFLSCSWRKLKLQQSSEPVTISFMMQTLEESKTPGCVGVHISCAGLESRLWVAQHFLPAQPWPLLFTASFLTLAKVSTLHEPELLTRAVELLEHSQVCSTLRECKGPSHGGFSSQSRTQGCRDADKGSSVLVCTVPDKAHKAGKQKWYICFSHTIWYTWENWASLWARVFWWCLLLLPNGCMRLDNPLTICVL